MSFCSGLVNGTANANRIGRSNAAGGERVDGTGMRFKQGLGDTLARKVLTASAVGGELQCHVCCMNEEHLSTHKL